MAEQPPKTRLQAERVKRQWTQQEVADIIGVPVKTLSRWERGGQNAGPHNLRALSEVFGERVDGSWLQRLGDTTQLWNVPYERNPQYTDQRDLVQRLHERLTSGETGAHRQSISGLGGIGKTQLALEYAYRYRSYDERGGEEAQSDLRARPGRGGMGLSVDACPPAGGGATDRREAEDGSTGAPPAGRGSAQSGLSCKEVMGVRCPGTFTGLRCWKV